MKMKNMELARFYRGLLLYGGIPENLPSKLTYAVNHNRKRFRDLAEAYEETISKLQDEHAERDDNGKKVFLGPNQLKLKDQEAYIAAEKEINNIEVDVQDIFTVPFKLIPENFNGMVQTLIDPMISEPEKAEGSPEQPGRIVGQG